MKVVDLGDRRGTECVGGIWPVCRCCDRSMRVSRSWSATLFAMRIARNDQDRSRNGRRVYMRCPAVSVRKRPRKKLLLHDWTTDMALLLCFQLIDVDGLWSSHSFVRRRVRKGRNRANLQGIYLLPHMPDRQASKRDRQRYKALTFDMESRSLVDPRAIRLHTCYWSRGEASDAGGVCSSAVYWSEAATKPLSGRRCRRCGAWQSFVMCRMQRMIRESV
jgi:hypothetical protein